MTKNSTNRTELKTRDLAEILRLRLSARGYRINRRSAYMVVRELTELIGDELPSHDILLGNIVRLTEVPRQPRRDDPSNAESHVVKVKPLGYVTKYRQRRYSNLSDDARVERAVYEEIQNYKKNKGL